MFLHRRSFGLLFVLATVLAATPSVSAQSFSAGNTLSLLFRGAEFLGDPLFLSNPQGGPLFNFNNFSQRVEFNRAGDGWTYEFFRFFGPDSFGNVNTLDLGPLKFELGPDVAQGQGQMVGLHGRTGFTTRLIPEVFFEANTGQRGFNQFSGVSTFTDEPIKYRATINAGIQDFEWAGNMLIDTSGRVNALGFYDFELRLTNVGNLESDGIFLQDEQVTDFDVGPINVSGNIGMDLVAGLFQAGGVAAAAVPPRVFSAAGQKDKTVDDLLAQVEAGERITQAEAQFLVEQMFITAFEDDPLGTIINGFPADVEGFEALSLTFDAGDPAGEGAATVPEPGTLLLLATAACFGLTTGWPIRRRRLRS